MNELDEADYQLRELGLQARAKFRYTYDFGDSWEHEIVLEKVLPLEAKFIPKCLKGERAGPPEDSGGVWGYAEKLEALADRKHPEHEEAVDWMSAEFKPEKFHINSVNQELKKLAKFWKSADAGRG